MFNEDAGDKTGSPRAAKWFLSPVFFLLFTWACDSFNTDPH